MYRYDNYFQEINRMTIGKQIQLLRKQKSVTQEMLASEMGVSVAAVSKWETGNSMPDIIMLCTLADYFKVSTDELLGRNFKMQNIIVCDDAAFMRETLYNIISEQGYKNIRLAEDGNQLMKAISEKIPDVILLDIHLPDCNGLEVLRKIKKKNNRIKIIMVSADNSETTINQATEYGADAFITKPFLPEQIKEMLTKHIY